MLLLSSHQILTNLFKFPTQTHLRSFRKWRKQFALKKSVCCSSWHLQSPHRALGAVFKLQEANCPWRCLCLGPRGQDSETQAPWSLAGAGAYTTVISAVGICAQDVSTSMLIPLIPRPQGPSFLDNFFQKLVACIQKCLSPCEFLFTFYSLFIIKDYLQAKVGCSIVWCCHPREKVRCPITSTKNRVWPLIAQKPLKRSCWQKGKFALFFWCQQAAGEGRHLSKGQLPHHPTASGQELL